MNCSLIKFSCSTDRSLLVNLLDSNNNHQDNRSYHIEGSSCYIVLCSHRLEEERCILNALLFPWVAILMLNLGRCMITNVCNKEFPPNFKSLFVLILGFNRIRPSMPYIGSQSVDWFSLMKRDCTSNL